jgi:Ca2+-binding EF-hand superfamily protein
MIQQFDLKFEKDKNDFLELLKVFEEIDSNKDSKLDFNEFEQALVKLSQKTVLDHAKGKLHDPQYARALFDLMDINENGSIDFREFILGIRMLDHHQNPQKDDISHIKFAFSVYDLNGDKYISKEELHSILSVVHPELNSKMLTEKSDELFVKMDTEGKGKITFEQFKSAVEKNPSLIQFASQAVGGLVNKLSVKK